MRNYIVMGFVIVLAFVVRFGPVEGQEKKGGKGPAKLDNLEILQADGLKNSNDVKVAEAKVRLAEAELERARSRIKSDIATAFAELEAALAIEKEGKTRLLRADVLLQQKVISFEEHGAAVLTYAKLRGERGSAEGRLRNLVGRPTRESEQKKD